tara:strand:- start:470 stop:667 length:198 start_codon:yes stop_codon:yes gene_type:complete
LALDQEIVRILRKQIKKYAQADDLDDKLDSMTVLSTLSVLSTIEDPNLKLNTLRYIKTNLKTKVD